MNDSKESPDGERTSALRRIVLAELPYLGIFVLTVLGVAYVSLYRQPILLYWQGLAVIVAAICIVVGWPDAQSIEARWRLIWTQLLHWGAFLGAMHLVFLPSVQAVANVEFTGLVILLILALSTFVAGVHLGSWRTCANGAVMAAAVPAIAWLDRSALLITLVVIVILVVAALVVKFQR